MMSLLFRLQKSVTSTNSRPENVGTKHESWWLSALCDDMCELPQAARLFIAGGDASEAWSCCQGRSAFLPSVLVALLHSTLLPYSYSSSNLCKFIAQVYNFYHIITNYFTY